MLAELGPEWRVLHDLSWPGRRYANIDHIAIGPTGVFVIDSKNWSGSVAVRDGVLRQNGYKREREVAGCDESALAVGRLIPEFMQAVRPVMCFVRDEPMSDTARGVTLCSTASLIPAICQQPSMLTPEQTSQIANALIAGLPARSQPSANPATNRKASRSRRQTRGRRRTSSVRRRLLACLLSLGMAAVAYLAIMTMIQQLADSIVQR